MADVEMSERFAHAANAAVDALLAFSPERATELGDHRFDDQIADLSLAGLEDGARRLASHRRALAEIPAEALGPEDRVDQAMLLGELDRLAFEIGELAPLTWDPLAYDIGDLFHPLLTRDVLAVPVRLQAIAKRLAALPGRLALAIAQLEAPPLVHVETALAQHPGTVAMVRDEVDRLLAEAPALEAVVRPAQEAALGALESYRAHLEGLLAGAHRDPRLGEARFARRLALTLGASHSPAEVLRAASEHLAAIEDELAEVAAAFVGHGGERAQVIREALGAVGRAAPDDASVVPLAIAALSSCTAAVRELGLLAVPEEAIGVEVMPEFRRGVAVAYCEPAGPLEQGGRSHFAIAPAPADWDATRRASFYREYNEAMLVNLTVHEAMPGHALQLIHARRFVGSSPARQVLASGTFVEGWAVHAERLMAEAGLGGLPVRLQQLKMQLRSTINAILDVSVHAGALDEQGALALMMGRGYQEEGEARGKWRRACLTSTQLSTYFVGYHALAPILQRVSATGRYDEVLAHGSPPPHLLADLLAP
ncbi:MAG: DUF885 domain-containing protein [Actinomycetota bacterium]|nr:DUF885 domain-containing protein [Actinomycetota bacterium]